MADLSRLHPAYRPVVEWLIRALQQHGPYVITSAYRSPAEQQALYNRYQRGGSGVYTVLPPGRSQHERGLAVDIARVGLRPKEDPLLHAVGRWWREAGGVWGGEADPVHFEAPRSWTGRA